MQKRLFGIDEWNIVEDTLHIEDMRLSESVMSLGNGYMGIRGNFEEKYSGDMHRGTYIAGIWFPDKTRVGWWKVGYPEYFGKVINSVNFISIGLKVNGHEVDLAQDDVMEFRRKLDMRNGILYRSCKVKTPMGCFEVKTERFLSIYQRELAAVRYMVRPLDCAAEIELFPCLDGNVYNEDSNYEEKFWEEVCHSSAENEACLQMRTRDNLFGAPRFTVCTLMKVFTHGKLTQAVPEERECFAGARLTFLAEKDSWVGIDKFIGVTTSRDMEEEQLLKRGQTLLQSAFDMGYDKCRQYHSKCWEERWSGSDVEIHGDMEAQQGIRFNMFQLFSTYYGEDCRLNIGPKGFTGEKYGGATYWDTEAYAFQMYLAAASPEVARNLLIYRHNQLGQAYDNAANMGLPGALYPMVTFTGTECHNEWEITFEEIHRNAAIAFAIYLYVNYTGDKAYLWEYGADVLVGIARFWAGRVHYSKGRGKFMIHGVTGPNEYENNVNNNWYTNRMAVWCLEYTIEAMKLLRDNGKTEKLLSYSITLEEEEKWGDIIEKMYLPYDEKLGIFVQQDTFLDKELISAGEIPENQRPINQHWSWDKILRSCYLKQADVLQGLYFLRDRYTMEEIRRNFLFYEPMTVHESSLSPCIHSILAAQLGIEDKAVDMFKKTARLDLESLNNDTEDGLHVTSMSGSWLAIVQGFAGMRYTNEKISFNPFLPKGWEDYSFKVNYRGRRLKIKVQRDKTTITLETGEPLKVTLYGREHLLLSGTEGRPQILAAIFDLDGVIVDTAKYHYLAWKRLAGELGYEFTLSDNEKFKGVNRMKCMELLAQMAGLELDMEEMLKLADKKNTGYVEYILNMGADEILPGVKEFITAIRAKGIKTALASASKNAGIVLDRLKLRQFFDAVVDGNDITRSKPDPQVFEAAAEKLGISANRCMVFEDAQAGIDAAKKAQMACIGIGDSGVLTGADRVASGFTDSGLAELFDI